MELDGAAGLTEDVSGPFVEVVEVCKKAREHTNDWPTDWYSRLFIEFEEKKKKKKHAAAKRTSG